MKIDLIGTETDYRYQCFIDNKVFDEQSAARVFESMKKVGFIPESFNETTESGIWFLCESGWIFKIPRFTERLDMEDLCEEGMGHIQIALGSFLNSFGLPITIIRDDWIEYGNGFVKNIVVIGEQEFVVASNEEKGFYEGWTFLGDRYLKVLNLHLEHRGAKERLYYYNAGNEVLCLLLDCNMFDVLVAEGIIVPQKSPA